MNPNIILAGRQPDIVNTLARSDDAAFRRMGNEHQVEYRNALRAHGPGAFQGNETSMNALAAYDPAAMQGLQAGALDMAATQQSMDILGTQEKRAIEQHAQTMDAAQAAQGLAAEEQAMTQAAQAVQMGDMATANRLFENMGYAPAQTPDQAKAILAKSAAAADYFKRIQEMTPQADYTTVDGQLIDQNAPGGPAVVPIEGFTPAAENPLSREGKLRADLEAGRITQDEYAFALERMKPKQMRITSDGKGGFSMTEGVDVAGEEASPLDPSSPSSMLASIDGILTDPALDTATGMLAFTQAIPGTPQYRVGTRIRQLEGQAFLQAFRSLKGGGQITEIEGQKATQAIARLDSAQSAADYRDALGELRGILATAIARPKGWIEQQRQRDSASQPMPVNEAAAMTVEQIGAMTPEQFTRLPLTEIGDSFTPAQWDALEARAAELEAAQ